MHWGRRTKYMGYRATTINYPMPAFGNTTKKSKRKNTTSEQQIKNNAKYAELMFQSKVMANFRPKIDVFVTLTHPYGISEAKARKVLKAILRHFRDSFRKKELKFKYMALTEKQGKWHHHLIMSHVQLEELKEVWEKRGGGRLTYSTLDQSHGYFDLVHYLFEEEKPSRKEDATEEEKQNAKRPRKKHEKRWTCSQNLVVPKDLVTVSKQPPRKPIAPAGYEIIEGTCRIFPSVWGDIMIFDSQWVGGGLPKYYEKRQEKLASGKEDKYIKRKSKRKRE